MSDLPQCTSNAGDHASDHRLEAPSVDPINEEVDTLVDLLTHLHDQTHNRRVAEIAVNIGRELGLPNNVLRVLGRAAVLHDVGKIGIPEAVLSKPGPLDEAEWVMIKQHPQLGVEILSRIPTLRREVEVVAAHHERMDGSGYPRGLRGPEIPIEARIVAVADTYDVLISDRPYRKARSRTESVRILREESGKHLDAAVVEALLRVLGEAPSEASRSQAA